MVRSLGAQLGLLAFAVAIAAGLYAGNSPTTILFRALLSLLLGCAVGQTVGWMGKLALREYFQRRKLNIDKAHQVAVTAAKSTAAAVPATVPPQGD